MLNSLVERFIFFGKKMKVLQEKGYYDMAPFQTVIAGKTLLRRFSKKNCKFVGTKKDMTSKSSNLIVHMLS